MSRIFCCDQPNPDNGMMISKTPQKGITKRDKHRNANQLEKTTGSQV